MENHRNCNGKNGDRLDHNSMENTCQIIEMSGKWAGRKCASPTSNFDEKPAEFHRNDTKPEFSQRNCNSLKNHWLINEMSTIRCPEVAKRIRWKTVSKIIENCISAIKCLFWAVRFVSGQISYTKSDISYTKVSSRANFVYEMIMPCGPKTVPQTGFRWKPLVKSTKWRKLENTHFDEKPLLNHRNFRLVSETCPSANFVLWEFRHTKSLFVYEISDFVYEILDFVYEIMISYTKISSQNTISIANFRLWGPSWPETKFRIRNLRLRGHFGTESFVFRIRNFVSGKLR